MELDYETACLIQEEFQNEFWPTKKEARSNSIEAHELQERFQQKTGAKNSPNSCKRVKLSYSLIPQSNLVYESKHKNRYGTESLVDPSWEVLDPTPDIHVLFMAFNSKFFWDKLDSVWVSWSRKMKRCAGVCSYRSRKGMCHIELSEPLLKLRPRKDLVETLLHEMIHAFLFVTNNNRDRNEHGREFHKHLFRINKRAGTKITVYHDFHDEVELYRQHWWRCNGSCQWWRPYFGVIKQSTNKAPGPSNKWWRQHLRNCGGTFTKIKSPELQSKKGVQSYIPPMIKSNYSNNASSTLTSSSNITKPGYIQNSGSNIFVSSKSNSRNSDVYTLSGVGITTSVTIPSAGETALSKNVLDTIFFNKKPSTVTSGNNQKTEIKTSINNSSVFTGNKNEINQTGVSLYNTIGRNYWNNKFLNTTNSTNFSVNSISGVTSKKRSFIYNISGNEKMPKLTETCSQDSLDCDTLLCPVCNIYYPLDELNEHLDTCSKTSVKECILCSIKIKDREYQEHMNKCVKSNFIDKQPHGEDDIITILIEDGSMEECEICENIISSDDLDDHLKMCRNKTKCPECGNHIAPKNYNVHLTECFLKNFDEIDQCFENENGKSEENKKFVERQEMVDCLACGKNIFKSDLNSHLDECLNNIFNDENDYKSYPCPFCLKVVSEIGMSDHIAFCLKTAVDDDEAENNKNEFLFEMN